MEADARMKREHDENQRKNAAARLKHVAEQKKKKRNK